MDVRFSFATTTLACLVACAPPSSPSQAPREDAPEDARTSLCTTDACVTDAVLVATVDRVTLQSLVDPAIHVSNGYRVYAIEHVTEGRSETATVTLPFDLEGEPPAGGFPVVVNAHGTIGLDDPCRLSGTEAGAALAGLFGARGAIGVAPDYVGLGSEGLHPYMNARSEATAVLDAARAALFLAARNDVAARADVALVGMSQGGHAAIAAAAIAARYAPALDVKAVGVAAPGTPYLQFWSGGLFATGPHVAMHAMLAKTIAEANGLSPADVWLDGAASAIEDALAQRCAWSPNFTDEPLLASAIAEDPTEVFASSYLEAWQGFPPPYLQQAAAAMQVGIPPTDIPVRIYQGDSDETVLPFMTDALVSELQDGGADVELVTVDGATHIDTAYGFLGVVEHATDDSVAWIQDHLAVP